MIGDPAVFIQMNWAGDSLDPFFFLSDIRIQPLLLSKSSLEMVDMLRCYCLI